uniref:NADH dehydrogenase subunit 4 n=1 Tax=Alectorobius peropteryx TaxID=1265610 RepID=UPI0022373034|nr:NADH dehydrogenase subunit 4 [Alectorobius peropteryx]UYB78504.1 NADH dehydrogenase subunit 4 [Alectorobius peropteryx]UYB78517.1 NADH dehydrogenase subunit 4 [Alectorobius peropteryx]
MLVLLLGMVWLSVFCFSMSFMELVVVFHMMFFFFFFYMNWSMVVSVGGILGVDLLGFMLIVLSIWIGVLMMIASMNFDVFYKGMYKFYMVIMILLLVLCFSIMDLVGFYLMFESVLIPIMMLIVGWGSQPERLQAGIYMLFYTLGGSLPLLVFLLMLNKSVMIFYCLWEDWEVSFIMFMMGIVGFLVKMPMYLVHLWLPSAHVEAPIAGSMVLAGVLLKLGAYGLFRVKLILEMWMIECSCIIMSVVLVGGVIVGMICLCQVDLSALIAYSSVCHMGLALGGIFSMMVWGYMGNIMLLFGHGLCSSGLFCLANIFYERCYTRSMILLSGLGLFFPSISLWWFLFVGVNMAIPPSMNLGGEILLIGSLIKWNLLLMMPLGVLMFLSAGYSLYMYSFLNHGKGWIVFGCKSIFFREIYLMLLHLLPLILWIGKMELFCFY